MAVKVNLESFYHVLEQSGLIEAALLKRALEELREQHGELKDPRLIADGLVNRELLTRWQADKLLQGKHRGFFLGKYRLLSLLGKGGMSSVYLADHVLMRRQCAIKVLPTKRSRDDSYLERFHREAQAVASLDHPHIVRAYDVDYETEAGSEIHFLVMEYIRGTNLHELVTQNGPLNFVDAADYVRQAAEGLKHAHQLGLVHRDIKPGNLLVDEDGTVKILDLGLARFFHDDEDRSLTLRNEEKVLGTADFLAPEQALNSHGADARADIYSLGCTFYFLLTTRPPFTEGTLAQRLMSHQTRQPEPVEKNRSGTPADLAGILRKMMRKRPEDRYQSAEEVAHSLAAWLNQHADASWKQKHRLSANDDSSNSAPDQPATVSSATPPTKSTSVPPGGKPSTASSHQRRPAQKQKASRATKVHAVPEDLPVAKPITAALPVAKTVLANPSAPLKAAPTDDADTPSRSRAATAPGPKPTVRTLRRTQRVTRSRIPVKKSRQRRRRQTTVAALVAGVAITALAVGFVFHDSQSGQSTNATGKSVDDSQQTTPNSVAEDKSKTPAIPKNLGPVITVGVEGDFQTISAALQYLKQNFEPVSRTETRTIKVAGGHTYPERIVLDNSDLTSRYPRGIRIVSDGDQPAVLAPEDPGPIVDIDGVEQFTLEGFVLQADNRDVAVKLSGYLLGTALRRLTIQGFTQTGIHAIGAAGLTRREQLRLEDIDFRAGTFTATGMRFEAGQTQPSQIVITGCRFLGPFQSGIEFAADAGRIEIRESIFSETASGVLFTGPDRNLRQMSLVHNTFYRVEQGIRFTHMPADQSEGLAFFRNLFDEVVQAEAIVEHQYHQLQFQQFFSSVGQGRRHNWSSRPAPETPVPGEINLFLRTGRRGVEDFQFASTNPDDADYLAPSAKSPHRSVGTPKTGMNAHIGAMSP